jgi:hypothetical protein
MLRWNQDAKGLSNFAAEIYPNPTSGQSNLVVSTTLELEAQLKVFNAQGQLVRSSKHMLVGGENNLNLDLQTQPKGMYFVVLETASAKWHTKLSKF